MGKKVIRLWKIGVIFVIVAVGALPAQAEESGGREPIVLSTMGSLLFGGPVNNAANG